MQKNPHCSMCSGDINEGHPNEARIYELMEADKLNRIFILPVSVGCTVWDVNFTRKCFFPLTITSVEIHENGHMFFKWKLQGEGFYNRIDGFRDCDIGENVFLTRDEAQSALNARA